MCAIPVAQPSALDCSYAVIGVAAGNFLGVQRIFPKFPKLARENSKDNDPKERLHFISFWAYFFKSEYFKHHFAKISPKTCPNFAYLARKILKNMTSKKTINVCTLMSGAIFVKSNHIKWFREGFHTFRLCPDFRGLSRIFTLYKSLGCALASLLHHCIPCWQFWCFHIRSDVFRQISDIWCFGYKSDVDWSVVFVLHVSFNFRMELS